VTHSTYVSSWLIHMVNPLQLGPQFVCDLWRIHILDMSSWLISHSYMLFKLSHALAYVNKSRITYKFGAFSHIIESRTHIYAWVMNAMNESQTRIYEQVTNHIWLDHMNESQTYISRMDESRPHIWNITSDKYKWVTNHIWIWGQVRGNWPCKWVTNWHIRMKNESRTYI